MKRQLGRGGEGETFLVAERATGYALARRDDGARASVVGLSKQQYTAPA